VELYRCPGQLDPYRGLTKVGGIKVAKAPARLPRVPTRAAPLQLVQTLRVGAVNDPAEHQAERMAAWVAAAGSGPAAAPPPAPPRAALPALHREAEQPNTDEIKDPAVPADHAEVDVPAAKDVGLEGLSATDLGEIESGTPKVEPLALDRAGGGAVVGREGGAAPADVAARVAAPGPGRPLPAGVVARMAPHFGTDFPQVRLHDTAPDRAAAARIGARAFAHGPHIWLGPGERDSDVRLVAHELTHVVQQTEGADALPRHPVQREDEGYVAGKFEGWARQVPGYTLLTVLVGKTLISGIKVDMTATNLLGGLFGLLGPAGVLIFDRLNETKAIENAFAWVLGRLSDLDITWARFEALASAGLDAVRSWSPLEELKKVFKPLIDDVLTFVADITQKVLEFIIKGALALAGPYADQVWAFIEKAKGAINLILEDPLGFAKNLISAIVGGFRKFGANIIGHLKKGLLGWLFGAITEAGITLPERLDFKGIISLLLQIVGVSYANFRAILVRKLGPKGERMVAFVEKSVEVVKLLVKEGFLGVWQKLIAMIENVKQTIIDGLGEMVISALVTAGIKWLAGLTNPVGAIVRVILAIYDMVVTFLERLEQIKQVALSIFDSVEAIAKGCVQAAIDKVEETIGRTVPVVLSFLAALMGLNTIPQKIKEIFKRLQAPVAKAMEKMVDFIVKKAKLLFAKLVKKLNGLRKLPGVTFKVGETEHRMWAQKKGKGVEIRIASVEGDINQKEQATAAEAKLPKEGESQQDALAFSASLTKTEDQVEPLESTNMESEAKPSAEPIAKLNKIMTTQAPAMTEQAKDVDNNPATTSQTTGQELLRAKEPRLEWLEGRVDTHEQLMEAAKAGEPGKGPPELQVSSYYQMDHSIAQAVPKKVLDALPSLKAAAGAAGAPLRAGAPKAAAAAETDVELGQLGASIKAIDQNAKAFPAMAVYRGNHVKNKGSKLDDIGKVLAAAPKTPDPVGHVKAHLKQRLETEIAEMKGAVGRDTTVPKDVAPKITAGFDDLTKRNTEIYGLTGVVSEKPKPADPADLTAGQGSDISFTPTAAVNLSDEEGRGRKYRERAALKAKMGPYGHFLEFDHILDKAMANRAAALPLVTPDQATDLTARLARERPVTEADQAIIEGLPRRKLMKGRTMLGYDQNAAWTVPLYVPHAKTVTGLVGGIPEVESLPDSVWSTVAPGLVEHVKAGNPKDETLLTPAREAMVAPVKAALIDRTDKHGFAVGLAYQNERESVKAANKGREAEAEAAINKVLSSMASSLETARAETSGYF
jgi:hypothetical protein